MDGWMNVEVKTGECWRSWIELSVQRKKTREEKKLKKECNMFVYLLYMQERIQWWCLDSAEMLLSTKESTNLVRERGGAGHKKGCLELRRHSHVAADPSVSVPGRSPLLQRCNPGRISTFLRRRSAAPSCFMPMVWSTYRPDTLHCA